MSLVSRFPGSAPLERLPTELIAAVLALLSNYDIKNLRLTCKTMGKRALLRLDRVFLSANPKNIEVFCAIADHEDFRHRITEIIWDDVQLPREIPDPNQPNFEYGTLPYQTFNTNLDEDEEEDLSPPPQEGIPYWFVVACRENHMILLRVEQERESDLPLEESWSYYQQLLQQQYDVLITGADIEAFRYGLERFISLERVTLTAAAHGVIDTPMYETPMIRSFPRGFNYPITHAWPLPNSVRVRHYSVQPWDSEEERSKWRGFGIIMSELAKQKHSVSEFIIHVNELETGLSYRVFEKQCEEYNNLITLLQQPSFKRLDLVLLAEGQYYEEQEELYQEAWASSCDRNLKRALEYMEDPRHVSIRFQANVVMYGHLYTEYPWRSFPLSTILPIGKWPNLSHLGLSGAIVDIEDLMSVLSAQSSTLRSVELSYLMFRKETEDYYELLEAMRDTLGWRERSESERPLLTIHVNSGVYEKYDCMDDDVNSFFYGETPNPFFNPKTIRKGPSEYVPLTRHKWHPEFGCLRETTAAYVQQQLFWGQDIFRRIE